MGKVGLTPIIGLAVVMALALAAVFGAMTLDKPRRWPRWAPRPTPS